MLPRVALGRWQAVQGALQGRFAGFGVDSAARDAARVLRLVGTTNTKNHREVRCIFPAVGEPERYSFEELSALLLPYADPREANRERARRPRRPLAAPRLAASEGRVTSGSLVAVGASAALVRAVGGRSSGQVAVSRLGGVGVAGSSRESA